MAAAAHNPAFAQKMGIPQKVAKDFNQADAGTGILKRRSEAASQSAEQTRHGVQHMPHKRHSS